MSLQLSKYILKAVFETLALLNLQFLSKFIENCKTVNIVTNDIARFKEVQERIYENENILIGISNNKSKALKRAR